MKESDIRPAGVLAEYLRLSTADAIALFGPDTERHAIPCPGCGSLDSTPRFDKHGFAYVTCCQCGSFFVSPRPSEQAIGSLYRDSPSSQYWSQVFYPTVRESRIEKVISKRVASVVRRWDGREHPGSICDVGAGAGDFLRLLAAEWKNAKCIAIEPGVDLARAARDAGLPVVEKVLEDCRDDAISAELVTCFEVIEHVHNPVAFARALWEVTAPGGTVLVTGLGGDGFDVQVLGSGSNAVSPPHHLNFLSVDGFEALFDRTGFVDVTVETPGVLDVELVRTGIAEGRVKEVDSFLLTLLERRGETALADFQAFLGRHRLSSHTWIWARRPTSRA